MGNLQAKPAGSGQPDLSAADGRTIIGEISTSGNITEYEEMGNEVMQLVQLNWYWNDNYLSNLQIGIVPHFLFILFSEYKAIYV